MAGSLQGKVKPVESLKPISIDSDGTNGSWVATIGYNRALVFCSAGTPTAGDSDSAVTFSVYKDATATVASDGDSDDEVAITAATQTIGLAGADSDGATTGAELIDIDFVAHGLTGGLLRVDAVASAGASTAIPCAASILLYRKTGAQSDTDLTIAVPASS